LIFAHHQCSSKHPYYARFAGRYALTYRNTSFGL
jgi:hypothetical protein